MTKITDIEMAFEHGVHGSPDVLWRLHGVRYHGERYYGERPVRIVTWFTDKADADMEAEKCIRSGGEVYQLSKYVKETTCPK